MVLKYAISRNPAKSFAITDLVERRPLPVHEHTGTPARQVCTLFTPAHEANADGKAAEWCGRTD